MHAVVRLEINHILKVKLGFHNVSLSMVVLTIGMAMVLSIIQYIMFQYVSNLTTWMDRPRQNTHPIKKLANYMVGKGVKLNK